MILGIYECFVGPKEFKQWLKKNKFPISYKSFLAIGFTSIIMSCALYILREFLSGRL